MSQDSARQPDSVRQLSLKLTNLKKEFHAASGMAIGSLSDTITAMLNEIYNDMTSLQARLDMANKEIERLKKFEPKKKEPPKQPEPEPPEPKKPLPKTGGIGESGTAKKKK